MKQILLISTISTLAFAIVDQPLEQNNNHNETRILSYISNYPSFHDSNISSDSKNFFFTSGNFRVILGNSYKSSNLNKDLANSILAIAEKSHSKIIDELQFKKPVDSDKYKIDIYIANRDAYNFDKSKYMTINGNYAGYTDTYSNGVAYIVINPVITLKQLEVTIAHEFFHAVQFSYFDKNKMDNQAWTKNIWFLEGSAVTIEDEVFPDNNDYISLIDNYTDNLNSGLEFKNGSIEYGKSIFFKYFIERDHNLSIIKYPLENIELNTTFLSLIEKYDQDFNNSMREFGLNLLNIDNFNDGSKGYPKPLIKNITKIQNIGKYGFFFFNNNTNNYLLGSNKQYLHFATQHENNEVVSTNDTIGLLNISNYEMSSNLVAKNIANQFELKANWNLIGNPFKENFNLTAMFQDQFIWILRDGKYYGFSNNQHLQSILKTGNIFTDYLHSGEGAWVFTEKDTNISLLNIMNPESLIINDDESFSNKYQLKPIVTASTDNLTNIFNNQNYVIFGFNSEKQNWEICYKDYNGSIDSLTILEPLKGYFIKQISK